MLHSDSIFRMLRIFLNDIFHNSFLNIHKYKAVLGSIWNIEFFNLIYCPSFPFKQKSVKFLYISLKFLQNIGVHIKEWTQEREYNRLWEASLCWLCASIKGEMEIRSIKVCVLGERFVYLHVVFICPLWIKRKGGLLLQESDSSNARRSSTLAFFTCFRFICAPTHSFACFLLCSGGQRGVLLFFFFHNSF